MASANLELVRSIYSDWERGDYASAEWAHPEIEFVLPDSPAPGSWRGVAAMREAWRDFLSVFSEHRVQVDEYRELDAERVLVFLHPAGRGKASGLDLGEMGTRSANLFHVRGGKVTRLLIYFDRDRALADLGLGPDSEPI